MQRKQCYRNYLLLNSTQHVIKTRLKQFFSVVMLSRHLNQGHSDCITSCVRFYNLHSCALPEPGGPWHPKFALRQQGNLSLFIQLICWASWISQVKSNGLLLSFKGISSTIISTVLLMQSSYCKHIGCHKVLLSKLTLKDTRSKTTVQQEAFCLYNVMYN